MYLTALKTLLVTALQQTFDDDYPDADWRNVRVGIEYPVEPQQFPGIWVDYDDTDALTIAGVGHKEIKDTSTGPVEITRWKFTGYVSLTIVALTSYERDRLYDEVVRVLAFGLQEAATSDFRRTIESNPYIAANCDFDTIQPRGNNAAQGTPWGTDEIIYERSLNFQVIGEFVPDVTTGQLYLLSEIRLVEARDYQGPVGENAFPEDDLAPVSAADWH
jgi:hypothetical protein